MPKKESILRSWYVLDAAGKPLGRVAAQAAILLRGKHKPTFAPHVDCGDHVIILNCSKAVLTGRKLEQKKRYRYTGYVGNLKTISYKDLMAKQPERAMELAIKGMIPSTTQGRKTMLRIHAFKGNEHNHQAQQPQVWAQTISSEVN